MVRGKAQGIETANTLLVGKPYKDGLNDLVKHTALRAGDLDTKAISLMDVLHQRGRAKEACDYLKKFLEGTSREKVENWRAYVYTLLRNFDEDAYASMKAERGSERRKSRGERLKEDKEHGATSEADKKSLSDKGSPNNHASGRSRQQKGGNFNQAASEFVPGRPWSGAVAGATAAPPPPPPPPTGSDGQKPHFTPTAPEFVPGRLWTGPATKDAPTLSPAAAEFVPGQIAWQGSVESLGLAAFGPPLAALYPPLAPMSPMGQMAASPFMATPGRPSWPQEKSRPAAAKDGAAAKRQGKAAPTTPSGGASPAKAKAAAKQAAQPAAGAQAASSPATTAGVPAPRVPAASPPPAAAAAGDAAGAAAAAAQSAAAASPPASAPAAAAASSNGVESAPPTSSKGGKDEGPEKPSKDRGGVLLLAGVGATLALAAAALLALRARRGR